MAINYSIDEKNKIIYEQYSGEVSIDDIIESKKKVLQGEPKIGFSLAIDMRKAKLDFKPDDLEKLVDFFVGFKEYIKGTRIAFLTDSPKNAAITLFYEELVKSENLGFQVNVFSTKEAADLWLRK
jgi:hypothetical protein